MGERGRGPSSFQGIEIPEWYMLWVIESPYLRDGQTPQASDASWEATNDVSSLLAVLFRHSDHRKISSELSSRAPDSNQVIDKLG